MALALLVLVWGYNWVVTKVGVNYSDPFTFVALRNVLGAIVLLALVALRGGSLRPKPFRAVVLFGFFQTSLSGLSVWALYVGSAGKTSVLTYTMPFWLLLIAWPVLGERIRGLQWVAVGLAMSGLLLVLDPWRRYDLAAELLGVGAGFSWAIASLVYKITRRHQTVDLLSFTAWQGLLGSIPLIIAAVLTADHAPTWNVSFVAALFYNVIIATAIARLLWLYVLETLPTGTLGVSTLAIPLIGVLTAWLQLGERPGRLEAAGLGLIVLALAVLTARELYAHRQADLPARLSTPRRVMLWASRHARAGGSRVDGPVSTGPPGSAP